MGNAERELQTKFIEDLMAFKRAICQDLHIGDAILLIDEVPYVSKEFMKPFSWCFVPASEAPSAADDIAKMLALRLYPNNTCICVAPGKYMATSDHFRPITFSYMIITQENREEAEKQLFDAFNAARKAYYSSANPLYIFEHWCQENIQVGSWYAGVTPEEPILLVDDLLSFYVAVCKKGPEAKDLMTRIVTEYRDMIKDSLNETSVVAKIKKEWPYDAFLSSSSKDRFLSFSFFEITEENISQVLDGCHLSFLHSMSLAQSVLFEQLKNRGIS